VGGFRGTHRRRVRRPRRAELRVPTGQIAAIEGRARPGANAALAPSRRTR
jgi:hypothetical protein